MEVKGNFINYGSYVDVHGNDSVYLSVEKGKVTIDKAEVMEAKANELKAKAKPTVTEGKPTESEGKSTEIDAKEAPVSKNQILADTINGMEASGELKKRGDFGLLMIAMNQSDDMPDFATPRSYLDFLSQELKIEGVPSESIICKMVAKTRGMFPNWTFTDTSDITETNRRINVGKYFISAVRKGR